jgi:propanediol dehydratase small subunit
VDQQNLEQLIKNVLAGMASGGGASASPAGRKMTMADYPLGEKHPELVMTPTGKPISDVTLANVMNGSIGPQDVRIKKETLEMQAQVAESAGRKAFAGNLRRAGELINVPDARLLEIYNALRPYHSSKQELIAIAEELESKYDGKVCGALVREAADVYEKRGRLKGM